MAMKMAMGMMGTSKIYKISILTYLQMSSALHRAHFFYLQGCSLVIEVIDVLFAIPDNFSKSFGGHFCLSSETINSFSRSFALSQKLRPSVFRNSISIRSRWFQFGLSAFPCAAGSAGSASSLFHKPLDSFFQ